MSHGKSIQPKAVMFVPHPDDELNLGGGFIPWLTERNIQLYVVVMSPGDYFGILTYRLRELIKSLAVLGISKSHVINMGYSECTEDAYNKMLENPASVICSHTGYTTTYNTQYLSSFSFEKFGKQQNNSLNGLMADIVAIINNIQPDFLFCNDEDDHIGHKVLSIAFDRVVNDLQQKQQCPVVFKGYCYPTSWRGPEDWYVSNIKKTCLNFGDEKLIKYKWSARVRFPVSDLCASRSFRSNRMYKAILKHRTQHAYTKAEQIVNGDKPFWLISYGSGGYVSELDFVKIMDVNGDFLYHYIIDKPINLSELFLYCFVRGEIHKVPLTDKRVTVNINGHSYHNAHICHEKGKLSVSISMYGREYSDAISIKIVSSETIKKRIETEKRICKYLKAKEDFIIRIWPSIYPRIFGL